jgi:VWFA-related protein
VAPLTYLAVYFDDLGSSQESLFHAGQAAEKVLGGLPASERVAIFTLSGAPSLDFTDDRQKIHEALLNLRQITRPVLESYAVLKNLDAVVDRVAAKPGERQVLLVSDGFVVDPEYLEGQRLLQRVIDHAVRARVTISWLYSAGLAMEMPELDFRLTDLDEEAMSRLASRLSRQPGAPPVPTAPGGTPQAAAQPPAPPPPGIVRGLVYQYKVLTEGTLAEITNGTGGQYVYQTNDLLAGLRKILTPPDVSYVLTFSPTALKADGTFHTLKVTLANGHGLTLQARKGYFAPQASEDAAARAKEEIEQAMYSQDEWQELPIELHTQFYKVNETDVKLAVLTHLDMSSVRFHKEADRNRNDVTFVTVLFDLDGKYVAAKEKRVEFRLRDSTLERLIKSGITLKTEFDVKPGTYTVRQIVRDSEASQLASLSRTVEIPF